ncbi:hypothetical protein [Gimesia maris]|uniref:Uncharacterized protein n=1 Tax=Gimesia maris TaxID=122 RepID=A0ABX5YLA9_9PLAN|nr:hypothetical protein [Gimesia maris]EDL57964.1 hypothetical protein PM8797T_00412 [Gimesia maris DSM 8797]QEG16458.1 hypothetical protein GmarT_23230 [Gimesia maris]QGQ30355.1 hypothetical protein F1729_17805 [Gimesia maris]
MRFSIFSLILSQLFFAAAYGQEQPPLQISSDHSSTGSPQSNINITKIPWNAATGPAYQRMSVSQKLIQQRAFLQAQQRMQRISARKAMGISPGRPTIYVNVTPLPTYSQIMQQSAWYNYNPYQFNGYWYGPEY